MASVAKAMLAIHRETSELMERFITQDGLTLDALVKQLIQKVLKNHEACYVPLNVYCVFGY